MKKEALLKKMESSAEDLILEAEKLTEEEFKTQVITGTWTAKDILSHIAAWDLVFLDWSSKIVIGEPLSPLPDYHAVNAAEVARRKSLTKEEIANEIRKNRRAYTEFLAGLTAEQLQLSESRYKFTSESLGHDILAHDVHHLKQIKAFKLK